MLENQPSAGQQPDQDEYDSPPRTACVARTRSGSDLHNTLTPVWEFAFSV